MSSSVQTIAIFTCITQLQSCLFWIQRRLIEDCQTRCIMAKTQLERMLIALHGSSLRIDHEFVIVDFEAGAIPTTRMLLCVATPDILICLDYIARSRVR